MLSKQFSGLILCSNYAALFQKQHREVATIGSLLGVSHEDPHLAQQPLGPPKHFIVSSAQLWHHSLHSNLEEGTAFQGEARSVPKDAADF